MEQIILNALIDFGLYSMSVLLYTIVGAYQSVNVFGMKFDWKTYVNGLVKWAGLGLVVVGLVANVFLLLNAADAQGVQIGNINAISPVVIFGIMLVATAGMIAKTVAKLGTKIGLTDEQVKAIQQTALTKNPEDKLYVEVEDLPQPPKDYVAKKQAAELEGGLGAVYSVPVNSYDSFRNTVNGNAYDIDGAYGAQCWDGAALLWQQIGRSLSTGGTGAARGCWSVESARNSNAGSEFELITSINQVKRGDVIVLGAGGYGHIAFADADYTGGAFLPLLGQNQGGDGSGRAFNVMNIGIGSFLGAFRFKQWIQTPPTPTPTPVPTPNGEVVVGAIVQPTRAVSYDGVALADFVVSNQYPVIEVNGDRAVLGGIMTAFHTGDLRVVSGAPAPQLSPEVGIGTHVTTNAVFDSQNGLKLNLDIINDGQSVFSEVNSNGFAVLTKDDVVRAAVPVDSLTAV